MDVVYKIQNNDIIKKRRPTTKNKTRRHLQKIHKEIQERQ